MTIMAAILAAYALPAAGSVVIGWANQTDDIARSIDVVSGGAGTTNVTFQNPTAGQLVDWANLSVAGDTWTGGSAGDRFKWTLSTLSNWDDSHASDASTLSTYLTSGLVAAEEIDNTNLGAGVNSGTLINGGGDAQPSRINQYGEALIMAIDSTSLSAGATLELDGLTLAAMTLGEYLTFVYYDSSENAIATGSFSNSENVKSLSGLGIEMAAGDAFIVAAGASTDSVLEQGWRLETMSVDVIPEPATLGMVGLFGAGALFIRRRFMK